MPNPKEEAHTPSVEDYYRPQSTFEMQPRNLVNVVVTGNAVCSSKIRSSVPLLELPDISDSLTEKTSTTPHVIYVMLSLV